MKCKFFILQELVAEEIFKERGERAWELLDPSLLITLDALREYFGALIVNNWHEGGSYRESGLRLWDTKTGAHWSQHKFGRAVDVKSAKGVTPLEMATYIIANPGKFIHITQLEDWTKTVTWLHVGVPNTQVHGIQVIQP